MKLYLLTQTANVNYGTYDSMIVAAENLNEAKHIHPEGNLNWDGKTTDWESWCDIKYVECKLIAKNCIYKTKRIVLTSFNAG